MPELANNPLARYRIPPDEEIVDRAIEAAAGRLADYYDQAFETFQKICHDFWGKTDRGWTKERRMALYKNHMPFGLVPNLELDDFLKNYQNEAWRASFGAQLAVTHEQFEPFPPMETPMVDPNAGEDQPPPPPQETPAHVLWRETISRLDSDMVEPKDMLAPYWSTLWSLRPQECLKMLAELNDG